jgi:uncharacterized protein GlcG (DUF336 family)
MRFTMLCFLMFLFNALQAEVVINSPRLSLETALKIAQATIAACQAEGVQIAVTVVDRSGHPQVILRDSRAMDLTLAVSQRKAYTALSFNMPLSEMGGRFDGAYAVPKLDALVVSAGGLPVRAAGILVGAVGVSGAPSGEQDERCAAAGIEAVQEDLDFVEMY